MCDGPPPRTPTEPHRRAKDLVKLVETMGLEPTTPCVQSRPSVPVRDTTVPLNWSFVATPCPLVTAFAVPLWHGCGTKRREALIHNSAVLGPAHGLTHPAGPTR